MYRYRLNDVLKRYLACTKVVLQKNTCTKIDPVCTEVVMYRNCPPLCTETVMYRKRPNPDGCPSSADKPPHYFTKPPKPTQPPTLSRTGNEYQPKCGDAVRLGSNGRYSSYHLWLNVWVVGKTVIHR